AHAERVSVSRPCHDGSRPVRSPQTNECMGTMLNVTLEVARRTSHLHRRSVALATYALATVLAYLSAYYVRFDFEWPADHQATMLMTLPILVLIRHVTHLAFRFTTSRWRFVGVQDVLRLTGAVVAGS